MVYPVERPFSLKLQRYMKKNFEEVVLINCF